MLMMKPAFAWLCAGKRRGNGHYFFVAAYFDGKGLFKFLDIDFIRSGHPIGIGADGTVEPGVGAFEIIFDFVLRKIELQSIIRPLILFNAAPAAHQVILQVCLADALYQQKQAERQNKRGYY